jgi:hypothetical protein
MSLWIMSFYMTKILDYLENGYFRHGFDINDEIDENTGCPAFVSARLLYMTKEIISD